MKKNLKTLKSFISAPEHPRTVLTVFFALLGSAHVKAAHKTLIKLTTGVQSVIIIGLGFRGIEYQWNKKQGLTQIRKDRDSIICKFREVL